MLYARDRSHSAEERVLERRHSLRLSTRLGQALQRAGSLRSLPPRPPPTPPSTPPSPESKSARPVSPPRVRCARRGVRRGNAQTAGHRGAPRSVPPRRCSPRTCPCLPLAEKQSLLSRLFRRSGRPRGPRGRRGQSAPPGHSSCPPSARSHSPNPQIRTFSAQFPNDDEDLERHPADWFNPGVTSLTSVATQTQPPAPTSASSAHSASSSPAVSRVRMWQQRQTRAIGA